MADPRVAAAAARPAPVVSSASGRQPLIERLAELWAYRPLVANLVVRDLKVRYKSSVLGFFWSLASPLLMMLVFWVVFGYRSGQRVHAFHVFVLVAILPWNWFSASVAGGIGSIVGNAGLINKVYFPREVLPISVVLGELVNFLMALPVLFAIAWVADVPITPYALWLPAIVVIQLAFTLGAVFLLATANVYYRDTALIMNVLLTAWFFLTPIVYPMSQLEPVMVPIGGTAVSAMRLSYILNPMASLISSYRVALYGAVLEPPGQPQLALYAPPGPPDILFLGRTAVTAFLILAVGYWVFLRHSRRFGEEV